MLRDCRWARERLALLCGGDLPAREARWTWAHLSLCADCRAEHAAWSDARGALTALQPRPGADALPPGIEAELIGRLAAIGPVPRPRRWRWIASSGAAAAILVVGFLLGLRSPAPGLPEPPPVVDAVAFGLDTPELGSGYSPSLPVTRPAGFAPAEFGSELIAPVHRTRLRPRWNLAGQFQYAEEMPIPSGRGELQGLLAEQVASGSLRETEQRALAEALGEALPRGR
jgi:hypothetical protein